MNMDLTTKATVDLKICQGCENVMKDQDRFCRQCGALWKTSRPLQRAEIINLQKALDAAALLADQQTKGGRRLTGKLSFMTTPISETERYQSLSGSLVSAVASGMAGRLSNRTENGVPSRIIAAFLSIPIWLMIILLSPLEAYQATRAIIK